MHQHVKDGGRLPQPQDCPDKVFAIMVKCWNKDRRTRWTFASLRRVLERELSFIEMPNPPRDIGLWLQHVVRTKKCGSCAYVHAVPHAFLLSSVLHRAKTR